MIAKTQKLILESVLLGLVLTTCLAMPAATIRDVSTYHILLTACRFILIFQLCFFYILKFRTTRLKFQF